MVLDISDYSFYNPTVFDASNLETQSSKEVWDQGIA